MTRTDTWMRLAAVIGIVLPICQASGTLMSESFEGYATGVRLPNLPYEASTITGISGDNPGIDALTDPTDGLNTVGGRTGANPAHHATMRQLSPGPASFIEFRADIMTDWSSPGAVDNLLYIASGNGDRDLLIGINDGLLSAFFEDGITTGDQRLRGNGGVVVTGGTWYTVRATVTFPGSDPNGLLTADWKLTSQPDSAFAPMVGSSANTDVSAGGDLTEANFFHWELRNSGGGSGGSYADNISITIPEPGSLLLVGLGGLVLCCRRRRA